MASPRRLAPPPPPTAPPLPPASAQAAAARRPPPVVPGRPTASSSTACVKGAPPSDAVRPAFQPRLLLHLRVDEAAGGPGAPAPPLPYELARALVFGARGPRRAPAGGSDGGGGGWPSGGSSVEVLRTELKVTMVKAAPGVAWPLLDAARTKEGVQKGRLLLCRARERREAALDTPRRRRPTLAGGAGRRVRMLLPLETRRARARGRDEERERAIGRGGRAGEAGGGAALARPSRGPRALSARKAGTRAAGCGGSLPKMYTDCSHLSLSPGTALLATFAADQTGGSNETVRVRTQPNHLVRETEKNKTR